MAKDFYNSRRYHSFFEEYTEKTVIENGKPKIVRVYTGDYYQPKISSKRKTVQKLTFCLLFLLTLGIYAYIATRQTGINLSRPVGVCQGFGLLNLLWLLICLVEYTLCGERMTVRAYRFSSRRLILLSMTAAVIFALISLVYLVSAIMQPGNWHDLLRLLPFSLLGAGFMWGMHLSEKKTEYEKIPNEAAPVEEGKKIAY